MGLSAQGYKVDVIITNPPFGGAENKVISNPVPAELRNTETADLFLVHIMALLKDGGRCGLVLPDGFLFGTGVKSTIKKNFLEECDLHTIVRLPKAFLRLTLQSIPTCCFYQGPPDQRHLVLPAGNARRLQSTFPKTKPMLDSHFTPVENWWGKLERGSLERPF